MKWNVTIVPLSYILDYIIMYFRSITYYEHKGNYVFFPHFSNCKNNLKKFEEETLKKRITFCIDFVSMSRIIKAQI